MAPTRLIPAALAAVSLALGPALSAHAAAPTPPAPVVTPAQAAGILAVYAARDNQANARYDRHLLDRIEAGSLRTVDDADYRLLQQLSYQPYAHFDFVGTKVYVPRQTHYPAAFVATARQQFAGSPKSAYVLALVFQKATSHDTWRLTAAPAFTSANVPAFTLDKGGYAPSLLVSSLSVTPKALYPALVAASNAAGAGRQPSSAWAWNSVWRRDLAVAQGSYPDERESFTSAHLAPVCFAVRTGGLCVLSMTTVQVYSLLPSELAAGYSWTVDSPDSQLDYGGVPQGAYSLLRTVLTREVAVAVPRRGSKHQLIVLGSLTGTISGTGTPAPTTVTRASQ